MKFMITYSIDGGPVQNFGPSRSRMHDAIAYAAKCLCDEFGDGHEIAIYAKKIA